MKTFWQLMALHPLQLAAINFFLLGLTRKPFRPWMWWHIFCLWEWESSHGSCARGFSVAHSSCNFGGKGGRTQWSRYLWNLVLTSNFMCGTDLRRFAQRLMTCPFENIVALKRLSSMQLHETMFGIFFGLLLLLLLIFFNVCFQMSLCVHGKFP